MNTTKPVLVLLTAFLFLAPVIGQFEDPAQAAYTEAMVQIRNYGQIDIGLELLSQLIEDYPDSPWAITARFQIGHQQSDAQNAIAIYEQIAEDYPGTRDDAVARLNILDLQYPDDFDAWLAEVENLAGKFGSPPIDEILGESRVAENVGLVRRLPFEQKRALGAIYSAIWGDMALNYHQAERAVPLAIFMRTALESDGITAGNAFNTQYCLMVSQLPPPWTSPGLEVDPTVVIQTPVEGSVTGLNPEISATLSVGDYRHVQIALGNMEIVLDGVDIKPQTAFRCEVNRVLEEGATFEKIYLSVMPGPLAPGTHTFTLTVPIEGYREGKGLTTVTRTFTVSENPPPHDETLTLPSLKDSVLSQRHEHQNEGANTLLTLEKIQGKAARCAVGFDLSAVDLTGLTRATLVLTVDTSQGVNGWGKRRDRRGSGFEGRLDGRQREELRIEEKGCGRGHGLGGHLV